ncbi:VapA family S-layer protein [Photobacterium leiognathi]|uniref:VapA family S-layer protein n=1 Tax=Photobacterium leiognathi TaxID=553611 RepID=UPI002980C6BD|nr:hypothetical protein [Photobacterium leiognathi]
MFKKTLLAAAMTMVVAGQANAFSIDNNSGIQAQDVASQSTAPVLQFQAGKGANTYKLNPTDLASTNFIRITLNGGATWNLSEVAALTGTSFISASDAAAPVAKLAVTDAKTEAATPADKAAADVSVVNFSEAQLIAPNVLKLPVNIADAASVNTLKVNFAVPGLFNLTKASGDVKAEVAIQDMNGSFVNEPITTNNAAFKMVNVFGASMTCEGNACDEGVAVEQAKVKFQYKQFNDDGNGAVVSFTGKPTLNVTNNTSAQTISANNITVTIHGDFSDITPASYAGWTFDKIDSSISKVYDQAIAGAKGADNKAAITLPQLAFTGKTPIKAQSFDVDVAMKANATFNAFDVKDIQAYDVDRDGFSFETVTTGTTANNTIYIRDVSNNIPKEGAKINVSIWEYVNGEARQLVETQPLHVKLMNNGAVTLTPAEIMKDLNVMDFTPNAQARFVFDVETNAGRAAVKKQQAGVGIDIQTGAKTGAVL